MRKVCEVYLVSSAASDERGVELTFPVKQPLFCYPKTPGERILP